MSAIKSKYGHKTILDFSNKEITKTSIQRSLRQTDFVVSRFGTDNGSVEFDFVDNDINVGIYQITLLLDAVENGKKLRDYGRFGVSISERNSNSYKPITLTKDVKFKSQYWVKSNNDNQLSISHLIDIIMYCKRLDNLRCFL